MNQPPKTGKRIVGRGEYAKILGRRATIKSVGILSCLSAVMFGGLTLICLFYFVRDIVLLLAGHRLPGYEAFWSVLCAVSAMGTYHAAKMGTACITCSRNMEKVIPLSRASTADLPAPESLLRASEEPRQEEQAVLLRATTEASEKHEEQLVRAVGES